MPEHSFIPPRFSPASYFPSPPSLSIFSIFSGLVDDHLIAKTRHFHGRLCPNVLKIPSVFQSDTEFTKNIRIELLIP
jgi:hypothetical protein